MQQNQDDSDSQQYHIDSILDNRINPSTGKCELKLSWKDFPEEDSWEPLTQMMNDIPDQVKDYLAAKDLKVILKDGEYTFCRASPAKKRRTPVKQAVPVVDLGLKIASQKPSKVSSSSSHQTGTRGRFGGGKKPEQPPHQIKSPGISESSKHISKSSNSSKQTNLTFK